MMNISDIFNDALGYPFKNTRALLIYIVLSIVMSITLSLAIVGIMMTKSNSIVGLVVAIVGIILSILIAFLINGYVLDIVKLSIRRENRTPEFDAGRQISNGIKLLIVYIVYYIVPVILTFLISLIFRNWIVFIIGLILFIIFTLAATMAECRLAQTDDLGYALSISDAIADISRVGFVKIFTTILCIFVALFIIINIIYVIFGTASLLSKVIISIFSIYAVFVFNRAIGLLYSDA